MPFLKAKAGELGALRNLAPNVKKLITPFIDIIPNTNNSFEKQLSEFPVKLSKSWGVDYPIFIDTIRAVTNADNLLEKFHKELRKAHIKAIPVIGQERKFSSCFNKIIQQNQTGLGIRLLKESLIEDPTKLFLHIDNLIAKFGITHKNVYLLLDMESLNSQTETAIRSLLLDVIREANSNRKWASIILAASAFPQTMSGIKSDDLTYIPRSDYTFWEGIRKECLQFGEPALFGDYGVVSPMFSDIDFRKVNPSAKIRYTTNKNWLICKGHGVKGEKGFEQFRSLASNIISHKDFKGGNFSWADRKIFDCANNKTGTGNMQTWVTIDINHHITLVSKQLANFVAV